ncbi:hypothetical protein SAMN05444365_101356 [Micromonospora pattaloongensis]|uniref:Uncharacterized protein n=1 Tax=Micromonospora pattaloongensis TaxID=405436 RepID=A0A1H3GDN9_9ACTN|nr:hypothetical protein SAMN05444365_101356 [Micromonospora pattaloongensis]
MERDRAMLIIERHQPSPLWRLLHIVRCVHCRGRWPCPPYLEARTAVLNHDRQDVADLVRRNNREPGSC